ncbi:somatostatin-2-like isoform X1 [Ahaetulla prasina]|uniref:somatostatin-2-like isoform X1 n=1 Tax=Ahaetulla prasina TaxID=499056 RepID=UPI00264989FD|nr:somatostatin-2-like isoform X1 [Ahaetulla prasina]
MEEFPDSNFSLAKAPRNLSIMPTVGRCVAVLLLTWAMCAAAPPGEDNFSAQTSREQLKAQKSLVLKMLAGLLNSVDADRDAFADFEDPPGRKLEDEPLTLGQSPHLSPRDRKTPCKNFFWKTFTAC